LLHSGFAEVYVFSVAFLWRTKDIALTDNDHHSPTILLTGAAGFIGSHLAQRLLCAGTNVVAVDNLDPFYDQRLKRENLELVEATAVKHKARFEFVRADITDAAAIREAFERFKPTGVIHLAAKAGVRPSLADPVGYARANVMGTAVMLEEARRARCSRLVMASSSSVYGNGLVVPFREDADTDSPISPYASTKRACELLASTHHHLTKMPTACLRFFTVFGPRQRPDLAIQSFITKIAAGQTITVFGDGSMSRDFTYIDDITAGILAAYEQILEHGYRVWNLGGNHPVRLDQMIDTIARTVGKLAIVERQPMQPGDVLRTWADLTRSQKELGFAPSTTFEDGVRAQWEWNRSRQA